MKRLLLVGLAEMLENLKLSENEHFDMNTWLTEKTCGTSACAVGWGIKLGKLPGLELKEIHEGSGHLYPQYGHLTNTCIFKQLGHYFEISEAQADHLFNCEEEILEEDDDYDPESPIAYRTREDTPLTVAARIRELLEEYS